MNERTYFSFLASTLAPTFKLMYNASSSLYANILPCMMFLYFFSNGQFSGFDTQPRPNARHPQIH